LGDAARALARDRGVTHESDEVKRSAMGHYVIRVKGRVSRDLTDAFPTLEAGPASQQTELHGYLADQAALAGVLSHLDMLGVDVLEVLQVPPTDTDE
jgi:hypothetical protein